MNQKENYSSVEQLSKLAKLKIPQSKQKILSEQIKSILNYVDQISEVDVSKKFKTHTELRSVMRDDEVKKSLTQQEAISGRKTTQEEGFLTIKSVINK